ncbi:MAG: LPS export ABC transporter periplasmic protein LptC [Pyrinomonadaceae bacterium]
MSDLVQNPRPYRVRARLPQVFRFAALGLLAVSIVVVVVGFYRERSKSTFRLKSEHAQLSTDVIAEVTGYERLESEGGVAKYYIKADHARTFSDKHQELQNMYLEVYGDDGAAVDKMSAESALYIPEEEKNFTAYLKGHVQIETRDALKVKTNQITYTKRSQLAEADELVEFERENVRGKSFGANVKIAEKRIELLRDVEIETFESPELLRSNIRYAKINAASASFDQIANRIEATENVAINLISKSRSTGQPQTTDVHANRAVVHFTGTDAKTPKLKKFELFDNVRIATLEQGSSPTNIEAGYALYDKDADRFELKNGAHIVTNADGKPTDIRANDVIFEQSTRKAALTGGAEISQGADAIKGDTINANLHTNNKLKDAIVRGHASARQTTADRTASIAAPELNAAFAETGDMRDANAIGQSTVEVVPTVANEYSRVNVVAARGIGMLFKGAGLIDSLRTDGRTTIQLNAPSGPPDAANKRVTADAVKTVFQANGKDIRRAEAVGNAELYVEPLQPGKDSYRTTINAPRFECEFFPTGNNAKSCMGAHKAKVVRVPTVQIQGRGDQTLSADKLTAQFNQRSHDIELFDASGSARFTELDRNAIAGQISFTQADQVVRLRGGEPTVWDSQARAKAREIDWDTKNNRSNLGGGVSTTYYSRKQMKDSAPFATSDKPVFMTAETASFDHAAERGVYRGNARGWQDNNYVRGDMIAVDQIAGRFVAEGNVQSVLYDAKIKKGGKESTVPTSAAAQSMTFDRGQRILQYRNSVDIRQGTDRIIAGSADVFLNENNEVARTVAETGVVITQPGRRAAGDWAQYTAADEIAILRGNPATLSDPERGTSQSAELTFHMRENRVTSEAKTKQNTTGRTRSVYKINTKP